MTTQQFTASVMQLGERMAIVLPFDPNEAWGTRERHHISGSVGGHPIRGPLLQEGERSLLVLGAAWRRDTRITAGMQVVVELAPEGPQADDLPPDFAAALAAEPQAQAFFTALATFYRKGYLKWLAGARKPEARAARIAELLALLNEGKKQR